MESLGYKLANTVKITPEDLIKAIEEVRKKMERGEEIPLVRLEDGANPDKGIDVYLTKQKIGGSHWERGWAGNDFYHHLPKGSEHEEYTPEQFAQILFQTPDFYYKVVVVWSWLNTYLNRKKAGSEWPFKQNAKN